jgi:beta-1,4-N-acetylglucosaminyltransferase
MRGPLQVKGLEVELYDYKPSLAGDIAGAAVVVSHAGAGTCLECLEAGRLLLVVVNEVLADNHQLELAAKLKEEGYLEYTTPSGVTVAFRSLAAGERALQPFVPGNPAPFAAWLNNLTGASAPSRDDGK